MNYLKSILLLAAVSFFGSMLRHSIVHTNLAMLYVLTVVWTALRWGRGPSVVSAVLSVIIFDFFFVPPHFSMTVADTEYLISFVTLFVVAMTVSALMLKSREQAENAKSHERRTSALYELSRDLMRTSDADSLLSVARVHLAKSFGAEFEMSLSGPGGKDTAAGPEAGSFSIPLKTLKGTFGVLSIRRREENGGEDPDRRLLETFANQIAAAAERLKLQEEASLVKLLKEAEKLQTAFLHSISHDLKTPLVSISGSLGSLMHDPGIDDTGRKALIETAHCESDRLNQLVGDLLDMARVEAGALRVNRKETDLGDLAGTVLKQMEKSLDGTTVKIDIPPETPEICLDFVLMMKVLTNVLDNAARFSGKEGHITLKAQNAEGGVLLSIADSGPGIPPEDLKNVFDKFYRVKGAHRRGGTGLGLSVCKGIVDAHGGRIWAENGKSGGAVINIFLPAGRGC